MNATLEQTEKTTNEKPALPVIRTDPFYRYEPGRKRPGDTRLRVLKDGTVSYSNPNCLKYNPPGSKPFKLPALNPRNDGSTATFERLKAFIGKRAEKDRIKNFARFVGKSVLDKTWYISCTDGFLALFERGSGTGEHCTMFDRIVPTARLVCSIDNPEFHLALKRALVMTEENSDKVRIIGTAGHVEISSSNSECGSFDETVSVNGCEPWHVAIDGKYLENVCGTWPLSVWFADNESPVMFESEDASWRFVIMPIKDDWKGTAYDETETANEPDQTTAEPKVTHYVPAGNSWKVEAHDHETQTANQ